MNTALFLQICLHLYGTRRRVALAVQPSKNQQITWKPSRLSEPFCEGLTSEIEKGTLHLTFGVGLEIKEYIGNAGPEKAEDHTRFATSPSSEIIRV